MGSRKKTVCTSSIEAADGRLLSGCLDFRLPPEERRQGATTLGVCKIKGGQESTPSLFTLGKKSGMMLEPPSDPPLRRHSTATSGERSASGVSIRQSVKRCLSPGWTKISPADKNNKIKRKQSSPLLVLVQNKTGSFRDNVDNSGSYHSTDIIGSFGKTTSGDQGYEKSNNSPFIKQADAVDPPPPPSPMNTKRKDSDASTTSRQINSDILDTYSSFSPFIYPVPSSTDLSRCS